MTKAGSGPKVEGSVKKASVPKVEGSVKKASVRKSQPRPCQVRADVGGPVCHQHGGKWLRKTGTGAARRDVYFAVTWGARARSPSAHAAATFMQPTPPSYYQACACAARTPTSPPPPRSHLRREPSW
eukprot:CAMPEP_0119544540 /NCGR_PEP_ID=MMETSP1344-20130328/54782_1 /TAXON_ID=236787 /ORGANISM="Florenciella parvula, Strain CCMP2471" /LENGTH=126 /DNA_ID=CAMNT_0007589043 /DNA_START=168 /DNA_END=549 /DNA_ORIENTATION=-